MKQTVLITGANSFIAKHLVELLKDKYLIKLLTRSPKAINEYAWDLEKLTIDEKALDNVDYIVHLAGAKLNDGSPLTAARKTLIYNSRIGAADFLRSKLVERNQVIKGLISASAIGYYGFNDTEIEIDENGLRGKGFAADLCVDWEKAADQFLENQVAQQVAKIRVSLVLGNESGIFPILKQQIIENGFLRNINQPNSYPWNHIEDMARIFAFAVENNLQGVFNSVAPEPASLQNVYQSIANNLGDKKVALTPFEGQHLVAKKIIEAGFVFKYPNIETAVNQLIHHT